MAVRALRVLVADDNESVRRSLSLIVSSISNVEIACEAVDGSDAFDKAKQHRPDIVLLDVSMPTVNGLVAARLIMEALPSTRIIMVSQYATAAFMKEAFTSGAIGYVVKSDAGRELLPRIRAIQNELAAAV
jgi:DNA-binding NarL/FixJ family response regulator